MSVETLNPDAVAELIRTTDVDVVDVRDVAEYAGGHIPGARSIPLETLRADPELYLPQKPLVFVCAKGVRSLAAAKLAERLGYSTVYNVEGGTSAWAKAGLPLALGTNVDLAVERTAAALQTAAA